MITREQEIRKRAEAPSYPRDPWNAQCDLRDLLAALDAERARCVVLQQERDEALMRSVISTDRAPASAVERLRQRVFSGDWETTTVEEQQHVAAWHAARAEHYKTQVTGLESVRAGLLARAEQAEAERDKLGRLIARAEDVGFYEAAKGIAADNVALRSDIDNFLARVVRLEQALKTTGYCPHCRGHVQPSRDFRWCVEALAAPGDPEEPEPVSDETIAAIERCPDWRTHGNPFRYCASCPWTEEIEQRVKEQRR